VSVSRDNLNHNTVKDISINRPEGRGAGEVTSKAPLIGSEVIIGMKTGCCSTMLADKGAPNM
jgi:hypothetical protein